MKIIYGNCDSKIINILEYLDGRAKIGPDAWIVGVKDDTYYFSITGSDESLNFIKDTIEAEVKETSGTSLIDYIPKDCKKKIEGLFPLFSFSHFKPLYMNKRIINLNNI